MMKNVELYIMNFYFGVIKVKRITKSKKVLKCTLFLSLFSIVTFVSSSLAVAVENSPQWPMFKYDNKHTGRVSAVAVSKPIGPAIPEKKWTFDKKYDTVYDMGSSPAIGTDGTIYFGAVRGANEYGQLFNEVLAVSPNGQSKWSFSTPYNNVGTTPAIDNDGTIYFGTKAGKFYALNPDKTEKWSFQIPSKSILCSPTIGNDSYIYFGASNHKLYVFNKTGTKEWEFLTDGTGTSGIVGSPAIASDNTVYVAEDKLYALDPSNPDKRLKWSFDPTPNDLTDRMDSSPAIGTDGTIYIGSNNKTFYAVNPDGTLKWSYQTGGSIYSDPSIAADGTVYVGSADHKVYAFSPNSSTPKWTFDTGSMIIAAPIIDGNGTIYITANTKLFAINPNGSLKWVYDLKVTVTSTPVIDSQGKIYIYSDNGQLFCIENGQNPTSPTNIKTISQTTGNNVKITWNSGTDNKAGISYAVYRSLSKNGVYTKIGVSTGTTFIDANVKQGNIYYYYIKTVDADDHPSPNSAIILGDYKAPKISKVIVTPSAFNTKKQKYAKISYVLDERAYITIKIYDRKGKLVGTVINNKLTNSGKLSANWTGKDSRGKSLAAGKYTFVITAKDLAGNQSISVKGTITKI